MRQYFFYLILFVFIYCNSLHAQENYSESFPLSDYTIKVNEKGGETNSLLRVAIITVEKENNLIEAKIHLKGDKIENSTLKDYDNDNNPEIIIVTRSSGSGAYANLHFYEFQNNSLVHFDFPQISQSLKIFHAGHESFVLSTDSITLKFPAYLSDDANCCPTGGSCVMGVKFTGERLTATSSYHIPPEGNEGFIILIKSIVGLPSMDSFSKTDCFIEIVVGDRNVGKTKTIINDNSPFFNENISVPVYKGEKIVFNIFDEDISKNEKIGRSLISKPISGKYPIQIEDSNGSVITRGEIEIEFALNN